LDAEDVVVNGEHVEVGGGGSTAVRSLDSDLSVIDARKVAGTGRLMLLGLKGKRVSIHTGHGGTSVVLEGLHLVEVLTVLLLHAILTVEDKLEGIDGAVTLLSPDIRTVGSVGTELEERGTTGGGRDEGGSTGLEAGSAIGRHNSVDRGGEVPKVGTSDGTTVSAEDKLLDGVVVGEADLLGGADGSEGIGASVLNLLNEVLVTLLGESPTLLSVEVDVVGPDLEGGAIGVLGEFRRQVKIKPALVVLKAD
tara:strand:+ start:68 stop:820 length:753 start_codon:yes stop_codon:yes gene_type:complete